MTVFMGRACDEALRCAYARSTRDLGDRTLDSLDEASAHFERALAAATWVAARPFVARAQYEYAGVLRARGAPGDAERAEALLAEALATVESLGMAGLRRKIGLIEAPAGAEPKAGGADIFRRDGEYWTIAYEGRTTRLRDLRGLHYIARLLAYPGREFHVADLAALGAGANGTAERVVVDNDLGAVLDARARAEYKERLGDLHDELDDATQCGDLGRTGRARAEIESISEQLTAAYGLGGRARKAADPAERLRKAVTNQIRRSLEKIRAAHPALGRHLVNAVRTGCFCSYSPERPVGWRL